MKTVRTILLLLLTAVSVPAAEYRPPAPTYRVQAMLVDWHDAARKRSVPAKIWFPADAKGALPIIVFSHGLGGSREGYEFLGKHWAGVGYVSVHLQHIGSDDGVWKSVGKLRALGALKKAAADPRNSINRPKDVSLAIDELERMNRSNRVLKGRRDRGPRNRPVRGMAPAIRNS
jgi:predicted dienelactone hydrolase